MEMLLTYRIPLNSGINLWTELGDNMYGYHVISPILLGYGLVDHYQQPDRHVEGQSDIAYRTSELGHKFLTKIDQLQLKEKMKEYKKKQKHSNNTSTGTS